VDETTLTDDDVTTEYPSERGGWIAAEYDTEATDADADDTDADADDADQDADADDPGA
jgi:hypothetical protein